MFEKIWESHLVHESADEPSILYIDLHLVHEVTSPQAFDGLRMAGRKIRRSDLTVATADHNTPTWDRSLPITDSIALKQLQALSRNCDEFGVELYDIDSPKQGIVHVIAPEQGFTQPGMTIVCGDSHTSTHGAFGAFALGIGTSEVEHVLATQTLRQTKPKTMRINVEDALPFGVTAKDLILSIIGRIGVAGASGYVIEYTGKAIKSLSMEGRMTVCNMSIEGGGRAGMIAPDETTFEYLRNKARTPKDDAFDKAVDRWKLFTSDPDAIYDKYIEVSGLDIEPTVSWGTNPGMVAPITEKIPDPSSFSDDGDRIAAERSLEYMGLDAGTNITDIPIDRVFIGSCTNSRIEDLRTAAEVVKGKTVAKSIKLAMVVPGSVPVKMQAEAEGLDEVFILAGFEWREPGCSMCLAMNADKLEPGERCASTSNRNFEGRQGRGGRTHLVSPAMAAAAAVAGHFVNIIDIMSYN